MNHDLVRCCWTICLLAAFFSTKVDAQNSTRKLRVSPDAIAVKAGTYVQWSNNLDAAIATSKTSGKPVFWYVPTIRGTFMDRKKEIDRYMMAGFFSWPHVINYLNENFVCVKAAPTPDQQQRLQLSRYKFVEPGFLIIANNKVIRKVDQITTQHPDWFIGLLQRDIKDSETKPIQEEFRQFEHLAKFDLNESSPLFSLDDESAYAYMIKGMHSYKNGRQEAEKLWRQLVKKFPNHPLAAKAGAELQGIGPYTRGMEIITPIPESCMLTGVNSRGTRAPGGSYSEKQLWQRGINFLNAMQRKNGSFIDSDYDFGGTDSLPNVHVAVTALAGMAFIESLSRTVDDGELANTKKAIDKCFTFVTNESNLNRNDRDEILWAEAFRLRFLCDYARFKKIKQMPELQSAVLALENIQSRRGSWYHEYENSFVTATALNALYDAKTVGAKINPTKVNAGVNVLLNDRFSDGAYPYLSKKRKQTKGHDSIQASAGRMPLCELALTSWRHSDQNRLQFAIEQSFKHHDKLAIGLKYDNHTSTHGYGGFFFWYDMRSRSEAISALTDEQLKKQYREQQRQLVMELPEIDGCFVDSHELGRCYGTAMALLCLASSSDEKSD